MNKLKLLGFIAATLLNGCAGAVGPQGSLGDASPGITITLYEQPSTEADLMFRIMVGELAGRRGKLDAALENYRLAARMSSDPRVVERAVSIALSIGDDPAIMELARRWYALAPAESQAKQALALALLRSGLVEEAVDYLEMARADAAGREHHEGFATLDVLFDQVENKIVVLRAMEALLERHPQSKFALYYHAQAALEAGEHQRAQQSLNAALSQDKSWAPAYLLHARVMLDKADTAAAIKILEESVSNLPNNRELRTGYGRLLINAERLPEAREQFEFLIKQTPEDAESLFILGLLAAEENRFDEAVSYLKQVLEHGAKAADVYFELGRIEELRNNYPIARDWYNRVTSGERYLAAQVRLGSVLAKMNDYPSVSAHFATLRRDNPHIAVSLYLAESEILREQNRHQDAFTLLNEALENHPGNHDLLYARALAAEKVDRLDILEKDLQALIEADPDNGHALNALGYTLADRTTRYQEALNYLERALQLLPEDAAVLDSMGWVKYRLGQYGEALEYLRRAYDLSADAEIASHLSEVLWVIERREEAREILQRAIETHPDNPYLLKVKEQFDL